MDGEPKHPIFSLLGFLLLTFGIGFIGTQGALQGLGFWYQFIEKPSWNPPSWVYAPVWTVLYALIAVAGWMVWRSKDSSRPVALALFGLQLVLNAIWTWLFFSFHQLFASAVEIAILWIIVGLTLFFFARIRKVAGLLLAPYFVWLLFAATLNFTIWKLNSVGPKVEIVTGPSS